MFAHESSKIRKLKCKYFKLFKISILPQNLDKQVGEEVTPKKIAISLRVGPLNFDGTEFEALPSRHDGKLPLKINNLQFDI